MWRVSIWKLTDKMFYMKGFMYPTRFHNPDKCSLAQYLTEIVIARQAKRAGILLTKGFWNDPAWKLEYQQQLAAANGLVKTFKDEAAILESLQSLSWVTSLRVKKLGEEIYTKIGIKAAKEKAANFVVEDKLYEDKAAGVRRTNYRKKDVDL